MSVRGTDKSCETWKTQDSMRVKKRMWLEDSYHHCEKPSATIKKPATIVMFPIAPKRGQALKVMRQSESRGAGYTLHGRTKIRRERQVTGDSWCGLWAYTSLIASGLM
eukprot:3089814-Amphidinium_carterae.2